MIIENETLTEKEALELLEAIRQERKLLEEERRHLEKEKVDFDLQCKSMTRILTQKEMQFEMKWKLLEEETVRLAEDKKRFEQRQNFFDRVKAYEEDAHSSNVVNGEMFFQGVATGQALKKRYRDLIKIYHPDNSSGDKQTIQEINREYENLQKSLAE